MNSAAPILERLSRGEEETVALGAAIGALCERGDLIAIEGDLGAGKTRLVRGIAIGMGIRPNAVHSPTFVLANEYTPDDASRPALIHIDAYRLDGGDTLDDLGWDRMIESGAVIAIEWPERIAAALPPAALRVRLGVVSETSRSVRIEAAQGSSWASRLKRIPSQA